MVKSGSVFPFAVASSPQWSLDRTSLHFTSLAPLHGGDFLFPREKANLFNSLTKNKKKLNLRVNYNDIKFVFKDSLNNISLHSTSIKITNFMTIVLALNTNTFIVVHT